MTCYDYESFMEFLEQVCARDYHSFLTLTTEATLTEGFADCLFIPWISRLEESGGASDWIRIAERRAEDSFDLHVLFGGRRQSSRYTLLRSWEAQAFARQARIRRLGETDELRGLIQYLVLRRGCGFRARGLWGGVIGIKGEDYNY
jgi:hypothetical protein